ncbi:SPANXN5 isoform 1, partial [Pongo abelii]
MDDEHPSTSGEKRKSPCDTNYQNEETQETPQGNSAPQPVLKKIRVKVRYRNVKKIYSTQLENHR